MSVRHMMGRLYYFTVEDEGILAESFAKLDQGTFAITYKVEGTEDVFVTTSDTKEAMDLHDIPYNLLAEEEGARIGLFHTAMSREELGDYEDALKALALAYRAIALVCVGVNGEVDLGFDLSPTIKDYTYFTAPAGHTFIWRLFRKRDDAVDFIDRFSAGDKSAVEWAQGLPLESADELGAYQ